MMMWLINCNEGGGVKGDIETGETRDDRLKEKRLEGRGDAGEYIAEG